jgi:Ca-activated chloride channel family protein
VGNEVALFEEIARRLGASRLFTVGIGSAPNSWFMRKAAEFGRGSHTHIGNLEEVGEKMDRLFDQLSRPAAIDLAIEWPGAVEVWPQRLPDLYLGQPLLVAARFGDTPPQGEVRLRGSTGGRQWQQTLAVFTGADPEAATQHRGVASVWARKKITGLLDEKVAGKDASEIREEVLAVALAHQLVSPYTSFVAVEEVVSRPGEEGMDSRAVANSRPRGQSPQTFAYPRGATTAPLQVWCGTLLLFVALMLRVMRRGDEDCVPTARA